MAHLRKKKGLGKFSILFLTQCTVMIFAGKGDILTKPVRRGKGICLFFGRKFDFGKEKRGEITGEDAAETVVDAVFANFCVGK